MDASITSHNGSMITSDAFPYTVPGNGGNRLLVALFAFNPDPSSSLAVKQNGTALSCTKITGVFTYANHYYCYLANPTSGIFSAKWSGSESYTYTVMTLQNAAQSSPIDASYVTSNTGSFASLSTSVTTTQGNDLLLDFALTALTAERLGQNGTTDFLSISFSSNDLIGHAFGPDSQEVLDVTLRSDAIVRDLLRALDRRVGKPADVKSVPNLQPRRGVVGSASHGVR